MEIRIPISHNHLAFTTASASTFLSSRGWRYERGVLQVYTQAIPLLVCHGEELMEQVVSNNKVADWVAGMDRPSWCLDAETDEIWYEALMMSGDSRVVIPSL